MFTMNSLIAAKKNLLDAMAPSTYTVHLHQDIEGDLMKVVLVEEKRGRKNIIRDVCGNGLKSNCKQEIFLLASFDERDDKFAREEAMAFADTVGSFFGSYCDKFTSFGAARAIRKEFMR